MRNEDEHENSFPFKEKLLDVKVTHAICVSFCGTNMHHRREETYLEPFKQLSKWNCMKHLPVSKEI